MAKKSLEIVNSDVSIAVTGIAGPTGGSIDKPVGLEGWNWCFKEKFYKNINLMEIDL